MVEAFSETRSSTASRILLLGDERQGIVHVVGPEQGITPARHGAGLRRQPHLDARRARRARLRHRRSRRRACARDADAVAAPPKTMRITRRRQRGRRRHRQGRDPRDHRQDRRRRRGSAMSSSTPARRSARCSIEERLTVCNMSIEAGARAGMVAPDDTTFAYLSGRPFAPKGELGTRRVTFWRTLPSDAGAVFDREVSLDAATTRADGDLGHEPGGRAADHGASRSGSAADAAGASDERALDYMGLTPGSRLATICRSTASSSAPAPTAASRTCAPPPRRASGRKAAVPTHGRAGLGPGEGAGRGRGARQQSSARRASSGARPAARCASA